MCLSWFMLCYHCFRFILNYETGKFSGVCIIFSLYPFIRIYIRSFWLTVCLFSFVAEWININFVNIVWILYSHKMKHNGWMNLSFFITTIYDVRLCNVKFMSLLKLFLVLFICKTLKSRDILSLFLLFAYFRCKHHLNLLPSLMCNSVTLL